MYSLWFAPQKKYHWLISRVIDLCREGFFCFGCRLFQRFFVWELIRVGIFFITHILVNFLLLQMLFFFVLPLDLRHHFIFYSLKINFLIFILFIQGIFIYHQDFITEFCPFRHSNHNWSISIQITSFYELLFIISLKYFFLFFCTIRVF